MVLGEVKIAVKIKEGGCVLKPVASLSAVYYARPPILISVEEDGLGGR